MNNQPGTRTAFFDDFDPFYEQWVSTPQPDRVALLDEAIAIAERLIAETDATGQGREYALIGALAHLSNLTENDTASDLLDAAEALVFQMNALVNA